MNNIHGTPTSGGGGSDWEEIYSHLKIELGVYELLNRLHTLSLPLDEGMQQLRKNLHEWLQHYG